MLASRGGGTVLTRGMAAREAFAALRHQLWFTGAKHLGIELPVWKAAVKVVWPGPVTHKENTHTT